MTSGSIKLTIGRRHTGLYETLADAQAAYCALRDASYEGASTFPSGRVDVAGKVLAVSYNGRIWDGAVEVAVLA